MRPLQGRCCGFESRLPLKFVAVIAQLVERILGKDEVPSSNLGNSSNDEGGDYALFGVFSYIGFN